MGALGIVGDDVDAAAALDRREQLAVVRDVERRGGAVFAADEEEAARTVERDAARIGAAGGPGGDYLARRQIDRHRRLLPLVRVGAAARDVDDQRLGSARHVDE